MASPLSDAVLTQFKRVRGDEVLLRSERSLSNDLAAAEKAERLAAEIRDRLPQLRELHVSELGAAIGAHVGPGAVGIVVAPFWQEPDEDALLEPTED